MFLTFYQYNCEDVSLFSRNRSQYEYNEICASAVERIVMIQFLLSNKKHSIDDMSNLK